MPRTFSVYWTDTSQQDLVSIIEFIAKDSIDRSLSILKTIREKAESLELYPERGRIVPELKFHNIELYRELIVSPWRIIYRIEKNSVYVLAVLDGRRNLEDLLMERILRK